MKRRAAIAAAACVGAVTFPALTACGDDDGSRAPAGDESELRVVLDVDGEGGRPPREAEVSCPVASGGGRPDACAAVADLSPADAEPVPPDVACIEIFGGYDTARVTGTIRGEEIEAELTRADGCEIDRFDRFLPLLRALFPDYEPGAALRP